MQLERIVALAGAGRSHTAPRLLALRYQGKMTFSHVIERGHNFANMDEPFSNKPPVGSPVAMPRSLSSSKGSTGSPLFARKQSDSYRYPIFSATPSRRSSETAAAEAATPNSRLLTSSELVTATYLGPSVVEKEVTQDRTLRDKAIVRVKAAHSISDLSSLPVVTVAATPNVITLLDGDLCMAALVKRDVVVCGRSTTHKSCFAIIERKTDDLFVAHVLESPSEQEVWRLVLHHIHILTV